MFVIRNFVAYVMLHFVLQIQWTKLKSQPICLVSFGVGGSHFGSCLQMLFGCADFAAIAVVQLDAVVQLEGVGCLTACR